MFSKNNLANAPHQKVAQNEYFILYSLKCCQRWQPFEQLNSYPSVNRDNDEKNNFDRISAEEESWWGEIPYNINYDYE